MKTVEEVVVVGNREYVFEVETTEEGLYCGIVGCVTMCGNFRKALSEFADWQLENVDRELARRWETREPEAPCRCFERCM